MREEEGWAEEITRRTLAVSVRASSAGPVDPVLALVHDMYR